MTKRRLRVAQLSFWFVHAEEFCYRALVNDDVDLVAIWDDNEERGRRRAEHFGVPFVGDLDLLLSNDELDAVCICSEPASHPELAEKALAAGKHVYIEKPMAGDLQGAQRIAHAAELAAPSGAQVMPGYNLRFNPIAQYVEHLVATGVVGDIMRVRYLHGHYKDYEDAGYEASQIAANWGDPVAERRDSLFYAGSHVTLWFDWMFGLPQSVMSMNTTGMRGLSAEDNSSSFLRYGNFHATMEVSETLSAQMSVVEIYGSDAVVIQQRGNLPSTRVFNPSRQPLAVFRRASNEWQYPNLPPAFHRHETACNSVEQFFSAILEGREVPTTVQSGVRSIAILAAAELSARDGREVSLSEVLATPVGVPA